MNSKWKEPVKPWLASHTFPKGNQPWIFIGRTDAEAEAPVLWPPDAKSWLIGKNPVAGQDWRQEKGTTEDEMVGRHHHLNGHEFEQTPGDSERQGSLAYCSPWVAKSQTQLSSWTIINTHRIKGNICKIYIWQGSSFQNVQKVL